MATLVNAAKAGRNIVEIERKLADEKCGGALDCPDVHLLKDGRALVRGERAPAGLIDNMPRHEGAVALDVATLRAALAALDEW